MKTVYWEGLPSLFLFWEVRSLFDRLYKRKPEREERIMEYSQAHLLARAIRESQEYKTYHALKESVMADETQAALIKEYRKLQVSLQMAAMSGQSPSSEDMQHFSGINALLFSKPEVRDFLLAEMQLQKTLADILKIVTEAADIDMEIPGMAQ